MVPNRRRDFIMRTNPKGSSLMVPGEGRKGKPSPQQTLPKPQSPPPGSPLEAPPIPRYPQQTLPKPQSPPPGSPLEAPPIPR
jgi:hypothetical protein